MRNLNAIQAVVFALLMSLLSTAFAADKPATQADFNELQKQVQSIDKDLAVLKETKAGLEKRQNEITAQQANSLAAIANQTAAVSNYIALTSVLVTLLVFGAGFITYFSATKKAKEEAREASKKWFDENAIVFKNQIETLKIEATTASEAINTHKSRVQSDAEAATVDIADNVKKARSAILNASTNRPKGESADSRDQEAAKIIRAASEALKAKPEDSFTADDFFARGLAEYAGENYKSAISAFENASQAAGRNTPAVQQAQYLFAKGSTLSVLDKGLEATEVYDDIYARFGQDAAPDLQLIVASALNGKSFHQIVAAKQKWSDKFLREDTLSTAISGLQRALNQSDEGNSAMILGNLGYAQFLLGQRKVAEISTRECLRLGGQKSLDEQLSDTRLHRIEPQDSDYEKMLSEIWKTVKAESLIDKKKL